MRVPAKVRAIIKEIQASGVTSPGIARALTARGAKTARGGDWSDVQVAATYDVRRPRRRPRAAFQAPAHPRRPLSPPPCARLHWPTAAIAGRRVASPVRENREFERAR
jgi:hypothetical protein